MVPGNSARAGLAALRRAVFGAPPLRQELIQTARRATHLLGESSALVHAFLLRQQNADGGFKNRAGHSDLYYTLFGLQALCALQTPLSNGNPFIEAQCSNDGLDFVHLCCLARCRALLSDSNTAHAEEMARRIEAHRAGDGGYHPVPGSAHGTAYAAFLAMGAYEDLQMPQPNRTGLVRAMRDLATPEGAWANERPAQIASTNSTAAAMAVLGGISAGRNAGRWLLAQAHPIGGFRASPLAPAPDLLSTATALYALRSVGLPIESVREPCLDFIDTLWSNEGGFHGHWEDEVLDVEYTFYGMLALGSLAD